MGFIERLFNPKPSLKLEISFEQPKLNRKGLKKIGEIDKCPYCKKKLDKIPLKKSKCLFCSKYIYSRKRPLDDKKVLLTEDQTKELDIEWQKALGTREKFLQEEKEYKHIEEELNIRFGKPPSQNDIKWAFLNKKLMQNIVLKNWGLYRNTKFEMAEILEKEGKSKQALAYLFEVSCLDLNGANNLGQQISSEDMKYFKIKEFDFKHSFLAPGIIKKIKELIQNLKLTKQEIERLFLDTGEALEKSFNFPLSTKKSWLLLNKKLSESLNLSYFEEIEFYKTKGYKKVRWISSAGERTCKKCEKLNGQIFDINKVPKRAHKGCRCAMLPIKE